MKKKFSVGLVFALVLVSLSVIALAAGLLLSPRVTAARLADKALEESYGVTAEMTSFFAREEEELPDGSVRVTYTGAGSLDYVLGTYTVLVKDGKAVASWTHDGEDTSGGYGAEAWGPEQMEQMISVRADEQAKKDYGILADAIREKHVSPEADAAPDDSGETSEEYLARRETEKNSALNARRKTEDEMIAAAREFILTSYSLTEQEIARLELYTNSYETDENAWYETVNGKPCFLVEYLLDEEDYAAQAEHDDSEIRNNSYFKIFVNVETGVIEQYEYDAGVGGEG